MHASSIPAVPGFEGVVGPLDFPGNDPGVTFNDLSPRIGVTYDITGDGKTIIRGNFARYYDGWNHAYHYICPIQLSFTTERFFTYTNLNGDRVITTR